MTSMTSHLGCGCRKCGGKFPEFGSYILFDHPFVDGRP